MFLISSDSSVFGIVFLCVAMIACILIFGLIVPAIKKSNFNAIRDKIRLGMSEEEMIREFGQPAKTVIIDEGTKVVLYLHGREKYIRGNISVDSILAVVADGVITSIQM